ncbi:hypothetical protein Q7P35_005725 [Cladosporium inversicolor]
MFTGIVETIGTVSRLVQHDETSSGGGGTSLTISGCADILTDVHLGDSISVNGTCLTVTEFGKDEFKVGVAPETLRRTNLGGLKEGSGVNLERAVRADTRMGGHLVQGHVDTIAEIVETRQDGNAITFRLKPRDKFVLRYIVEKGYVCLDGASLTITAVNDEEGWWEIMMIAYTQEKVVMGNKRKGDDVNIEVDQVGKYVEKSVAAYFEGSGASGGAMLEKMHKPSNSEHIGQNHTTIMADLKDATNDFPYMQYPEVERLTKVVCDIGDVLLVADDGSHPPLRTQASSVLLSTASKVFRTLLRGSFAEGEAMRNATHSLVEIRVSDTPADLLLLCQLLHFQGDLDKVKHEQFLDLALIIDKYDCAQALRYATTSKFAALEPDDLGQTVKLSYLAAAWILDQPEAFRRLSKSIVTCHEYGPAAVEGRILFSMKTNIHAHQDRMYGGGGGCWESPSQTPPPKAVEPTTKFEWVLIVERIELFCVGLCLDCLKGNMTCRAEHTDPFSQRLCGSRSGT